MLVHGVDALDTEAARFARGLIPRAHGATVVALHGDLGAGKTTFARAVLRAFGVEEGVTSPTFVIAKTYTLKKGSFSRAVHIDAYRLSGAQELGPVGLSEILSDAHTLVLLEWPEQVPGALPKDTITIRLTYIDETTRDLDIV